MVSNTSIFGKKRRSISNENPTFVDVYFACLPKSRYLQGCRQDDLTISQTKTPILQYNEYYPFGLQTMESWTRENTTNQYLYNSATELNGATGLYDLAFRNYDPVLGRFAQVDPLADMYGSQTPYNYGNNDPVYFNDPAGLSSTTGTSSEGRCNWCNPGQGGKDNTGGEYGGLFERNQNWSASTNRFRYISESIDNTNKYGGYVDSETGRMVYPNKDNPTTGKRGTAEAGEVEYADDFDMTFAGGKLYLKTIEGIMKAIQQMWTSSLKLKRENMAVFTDQGVLVLPNEFTNKYGIKRVNGDDNSWASTDFLAEIINSDGTGVSWNETELQIWGLSHTHPISQAAGGVERHSERRNADWEYRYSHGVIGNFVYSYSGYYVAGPDRSSTLLGERKKAYLEIFKRYNP